MTGDLVTLVRHGTEKSDNGAAESPRPTAGLVRRSLCVNGLVMPWWGNVAVPSHNRPVWWVSTLSGR